MPGDLDALTSLEDAAFGREAWSKEQVADELDGASRHVVVAEEAGAVIGYGSLVVAGDTADVVRIAVLPGRRRTGVGRRLLAALLGESERRGVERVLLEVASDNVAATGLYEAGGFAAIATRPNYYRSGADAVVMERRVVPRRDG
ncbi:ribosomal protein S18-alanine N-acetyltransferase [Mumia sp. zg.B53]|uniref:ribosomal protein S18-alanine N-acetyltransferase n=1 Tax=unclassified Mumia TaxID=2621872 RepID=UPI001C6EA3C3|nr:MULTISPECIES: ribosomal protein S18-alanine N-acetyltransferase [unclassified Mumia]MBW9209264.1 ribosomal protein S18-alanine N-acetyltransferase [Mumia sp. zg.B21]MBW9213873.1 ribosomal protein S18-alanine N-acetyltransferase [Mumia sp. zg.B53]